jgi:rfaE bifunctional protein kinase chain/domain
VALELPDFSRLRLAVLGDPIADRYVEGLPSRLSREAPVLVLRHSSEELRAGGAANVARNLVELGARCTLFGVVGDCPAGRALRAGLAADGVDVGALAEGSGWSTPTKTRFLAGERHRMPQQVLRVDREPEGPPPAQALAQVAADLAERAGEYDALVVSDYGYGGLDPSVLEVAQRLAAHGVPVIVDPRRRADIVGAPTALTPNLDELARFAGTEPAELESPVALQLAAEQVLAQVGARWLLATLGNRGMALFGRRGERFDVGPSGREPVVDVSGAGDTAAASFALCLAAGVPPEQAMAIANAAAGLVVLERGPAAPDLRRLARVLRDAPQPVQRNAPRPAVPELLP